MYEIILKEKTFFFYKHKVPKFLKFLKKILAWTVFFNFSNEYKKLLTRPLAIFFTIDAFDQFEPPNRSLTSSGGGPAHRLENPPVRICSSLIPN
jgi:hypothetical protein